MSRVQVTQGPRQDTSQRQKKASAPCCESTRAKAFSRAAPAGAENPLRSLHGSTAAHEPDDEQHERDHEQHIDEVAHRVAADESEQPQNKQNHRDRKKHRSLLPLLFSTEPAKFANP